MTDKGPAPEFGPRGYLPERASQRARKIMLRAPMGLQWILGAVVFGLVVVVAGMLWLTSGGPPGAPYVAAGPLPDGVAVTRVEAADAWLVTGLGPTLAVAGGQVDTLTWCEPSGHLEAADGRTWTATGRGLGTASLVTHPVVVHDGLVYIDPTVRLDGTRPSDEAVAPACTAR